MPPLFGRPQPQFRPPERSPCNEKSLFTSASCLVFFEVRRPAYRRQACRGLCLATKFLLWSGRRVRVRLSAILISRPSTHSTSPSTAPILPSPRATPPARTVGALLSPDRPGFLPDSSKIPALPSQTTSSAAGFFLLVLDLSLKRRDLRCFLVRVLCWRARFFPPAASATVAVRSTWPAGGFGANLVIESSIVTGARFTGVSSSTSAYRMFFSTGGLSFDCAQPLPQQNAPAKTRENTRREWVIGDSPSQRGPLRSCLLLLLPHAYRTRGTAGYCSPMRYSLPGCLECGGLPPSFRLPRSRISVVVSDA